MRFFPPAAEAIDGFVHCGASGFHSYFEVHEQGFTDFLAHSLPREPIPIKTAHCRRAFGGQREPQPKHKDHFKKTMHFPLLQCHRFVPL